MQSRHLHHIAGEGVIYKNNSITKDEIVKHYLDFGKQFFLGTSKQLFLLSGPSKDILTGHFFPMNLKSHKNKTCFIKLCNRLPLQHRTQTTEKFACFCSSVGFATTHLATIDLLSFFVGNIHRALRNTSITDSPTPFTSTQLNCKKHSKAKL